MERLEHLESMLKFIKTLFARAALVFQCKYGENAWQTPAALFSFGTADPLALDRFRLVEGTSMSYNNAVDLERLLQTITHIAAGFAVNFGSAKRYIAVGGKHGNACGAAVADNPLEALKKMLAGDQISIFGGLIIVNFAIDESVLEALEGVKLDGIIAPSISAGAVEKLRRAKNKCRFLTNPALLFIDANMLDTAMRFRYVRGGIICQSNYTYVPRFMVKEGNIVSYGPHCSIEQISDMILAWAVGSTSNSNTITLVNNGMLLANGAGQQSRVFAAKVACMKAKECGHSVIGAVAYSDSFFPESDGPQVLIDAGIRVIFTSSGSIKDNLTINLCEERGVSLYMVPDAEGRGFCAH